MRLKEEVKKYEISTTPTELRDLALILEKRASSTARFAESLLLSSGVSLFITAGTNGAQITFQYRPGGAEETAQLKASYDRLFPPDEDA